MSNFLLLACQTSCQTCLLSNLCLVKLVSCLLNFLLSNLLLSILLVVLALCLSCCPKVQSSIRGGGGEFYTAGGRGGFSRGGGMGRGGGRGGPRGGRGGPRGGGRGGWWGKEVSPQHIYPSLSSWDLHASCHLVPLKLLNFQFVNCLLSSVIQHIYYHHNILFLKIDPFLHFPILQEFNLGILWSIQKPGNFLQKRIVWRKANIIKSCKI